MWRSRSRTVFQRFCRIKIFISILQKSSGITRRSLLSAEPGRMMKGSRKQESTAGRAGCQPGDGKQDSLQKQKSGEKMEKDTEKAVGKKKKTTGTGEQERWKHRLQDPQTAGKSSATWATEENALKGGRRSLWRAVSKSFPASCLPAFNGREYPFSVSQDGSLDFTCFQARSESLRKKSGRMSAGIPVWSHTGGRSGSAPSPLQRHRDEPGSCDAGCGSCHDRGLLQPGKQAPGRGVREEGAVSASPLQPPAMVISLLNISDPLRQPWSLEKRAGITLTDSLLMVPSKSVTAVIGIGSEACSQAGTAGGRSCEACQKEDCMYRERKEGSKGQVSRSAAGRAGTGNRQRK